MRPSNFNVICFEALESTKISSYEPVSSQKYENGYRTKICNFTVSTFLSKTLFLTSHFSYIFLVAGMFHFLKARATPPSKELEPQIVDIKIFLEELNDDCVVGFFPDREAYEYQLFDELADMYHVELKFRHVFGGMEIAQKHFGVKVCNR